MGSTKCEGLKNRSLLVWALIRVTSGFRRLSEDFPRGSRQLSGNAALIRGFSGMLLSGWLSAGGAYSGRFRLGTYFL